MKQEKRSDQFKPLKLVLLQHPNLNALTICLIWDVEAECSEELEEKKKQMNFKSIVINSKKVELTSTRNRH